MTKTYSIHTADDILRFQEEMSYFQSAEDWLASEKETAPNGMNFREELQAIENEDLRIHLIEEQYGYLIQSRGFRPDEAKKYLLHAARDLAEPKKLRQAIDKGVLLHKYPDIEKRLDKAARASRHRRTLEQSVRHRHFLEPVHIGIPEIDNIIPGGVNTGEVLHFVASEGGMKTSLLLQVLCNYVNKGGTTLFFSLDMSPETIETRLLMRIANCGKEQMLEYINRDSEEYRSAREIRIQQDEKFLIMGGPLTLEQMERAILTSKADLVAIDYLTLIEGYNSDLDTARAATKAIRGWANQWGTTFIILSQVSRESLRDIKAGGTGGHAIGGSSLEQLVDYEIELEADAPLLPGDKPRLIAKLRKNRSGPKAMFEIFPQFPSMVFMNKAERVDFEKRIQPKFSAWGTY